MWTQFAFLVFCSFFSLAFAGCATFPTHTKSNPEGAASVTAGWSVERLLRQTCQTGKGAQNVEGTVWLKTQSKEVHGQFNASVLAHAPDDLKLEVTNFLGGTVALISVRQGRYQIMKSASESINVSGYESWGGIPLRWATDLFLGYFPCPPSSARLILTKEEASQFTIEALDDTQGIQRFSFKYRKIESEGGGQPWPESLHWERFSVPKAIIDFKFDKPEQLTLSPLQWEASSSEGAIKVRWKERQRVTTDESK